MAGAAPRPREEAPPDVDGFALKVWLAGSLILLACHALDPLLYWLGAH